MNLASPIDSLVVKVILKDVGMLAAPRLSRPSFEVDENDFFLDVRNIARYRVQNGNKVFIHPHENADIASIKLFLNGSVLGAALHQQGMLPFHGSSFEYEGKGVIICGYSGVGKSSVTAAFCQNGGSFINDDITPVRITGPATFITPIKTGLKLWDDSLRKLHIEKNGLEKIRPALDKFYLADRETSSEEQRLDHLLILGTHQQEEFIVNELNGMDKYNVLRKQIYRRVYLKGMPSTEKSYFKQLFQLAARIRVTQILRPAICDIYETMACIQKEILR